MRACAAAARLRPATARRPAPRLVAAAACLLWAIPPAAADGEPISTAPAAALPAAADAAVEAVLPLYTWLHAHPELSGAEAHTAARLAGELRAVGAEVHTGLGGHGVVALLRNRQRPEGRGVLLRADMDALPLTERTGLPYSSGVPGVCHACGHDLHMAVAVGVAQVLRAHEGLWQGTLVLLGQPAEEVGSGARAMLDDPRLRPLLATAPPLALALAWHDDAMLPAGSVGVRGGPITAHVDGLDVTVFGVGAHGARPHLGVDAVVIAAETVLTWQSIVARQLPPGEPLVLTVGQLQAGSKRNIIADEATLRLTVRSQRAAARDRVLAAIDAVATHVAAAHGAPRPPTVRVAEPPIPAVHNDPAWAALLRRTLEDELGAAAVVEAEASLGGEDFSLFAELHCPLQLLRLGAANAAALAAAPAAVPGLHTAAWAPDVRPTLRTGIAAMVRLVGVAGAARLDSAAAPL